MTALTPPRGPMRQASELYTGLLFLLPENPRRRDQDRIAQHQTTPVRGVPEDPAAELLRGQLA